MKIKKVVCSAGRSGFYFDDQMAIKHGALNDGFDYIGETELEGFTAVRQAGESISVNFILEDGQIATGDCAAVQYSGAGGRDPLFLAETFLPMIEQELIPLYQDREITTFREMAAELENLLIDNKRLHTAIRYGFSQAILDAVAKSNKQMICETVAQEYGTEISEKLIPIFTQSGDDRYINADKMIIKRVPILPHALINNVKSKLGENGELLKEYLKWLVQRINDLSRSPEYKPIIQLDVYGTFGELFGIKNHQAIVDYLADLVEICEPYKLHIEGPIDGISREECMYNLAKITELVNRKKLDVVLVADEWCNTLEDIKLFAEHQAGHMIQIKTPDLGGLNNTIEAVLYCKKHGVKAYVGGTCNETDISARICMQVAMAVCPAQVLAKPGMGVDEAYMIAFNEMQRILAIRATKKTE
ncbi:MAG TPA: methylaspartate ammonia-lyase [Clostridiaceae bacterium]|nr:methylaspartate ammonia-lyase [Clostridiaceae bacterium]